MDERTNPLDRLKDSLTAALWRTRPEHGPVPWIVIRLLRTLFLAAKGFDARQGPLHASALTFYSLLSLVPLAAMAFGVAKGFGFEQMLERELLKHFAAQQEVVLQVIGFARNMLDNTKGGLIAGVGVAVLFWSVIKVLGRIEESFNLIWGVTPRPLMRKLSDYLTVMIIGPVLLIMSGSVTVFIASQVSALSSQVGLENVVDPAVSLGLALAPYVLLWVLFALVYMIMPNTRVRLGSAMLGAVLTGSAYQLLQVAYVRFQIGVSSYNAIYGSFAALPLFLVWLQLSWIIVIFGAEIVHAFPDSEFPQAESGCATRSISQTRVLALAICHEVVSRFHRGETPPNEKELSTALDISIAEIHEMTDMLDQAGILSRTAHGESPALQPARDSSGITVQDVLTAVDNAHARAFFPNRHPKMAAMADCLRRLGLSADGMPNSALLRDVPLANSEAPDDGTAGKN
ncbi:YihY/virulence factor BrkB family protein [Desulfomicrobium salsuginis]